MATFAYQVSGFAYQGAGQFAYQGSAEAPVQTVVDPGDKPPYRKSPHKGFDLERWRKERGALDQSLEETIERAWAEIKGDSLPEDIRAEADRIVAPYVRTGSALLPGEEPRFIVDWAAMASQLRAVHELAQAHARAEAHRRIREEDDEVITIFLLS